MLEVLNQDFVLTARAKGISERLVVMRHVLRNALIPVVTILGFMLGNMLSGAVITETIFARLGIGQKYVEAVLQKDFTMVQGTTLVHRPDVRFRQYRGRYDLRLCRPAHPLCLSPPRLIALGSRSGGDSPNASCARAMSWPARWSCWR